MSLFHPGLCLCPGGSFADAPTDTNGRTTFTGAIFGGGCVEQLDVYVVGIWLGTVPVRVNSPDSNADCGVDSGDLVRFASHLGSREGEPRYSFCFDFNADGGVDQSDLCILASVYSTVCR